MQPVLPTAYLPPLSWWAIALAGKGVQIEYHENYIRQTFRNRCRIYSGNGKLSLSIPVKKVSGNHTVISDILIDYSSNWQKVHWKSLESAYMKTPYFQFYADELQHLIMQKSERLLDFNDLLIRFCLRCLNPVEFAISETLEYMKQLPAPDYRLLLSPKFSPEKYGFSFFPRYIQAFEHVEGFLPNLSIIDLLCNEGPSSRLMLEKILIANTSGAAESQQDIQS